LSAVGENILSVLFAEELGAVIQISDNRLGAVQELLEKQGLGDICHVIGSPVRSENVIVEFAGEVVVDESIVTLRRAWSETSYQMQKLRDNPECAQQEYDLILRNSNPSLFSKLSFDPGDDVAAPFIGGNRPRLAVLREEGVNGQVEMAAAFERAGFTAVDVHMSDILTGRVSLDDFTGIAACGDNLECHCRSRQPVCREPRLRLTTAAKRPLQRVPVG